MTRKHFAAIAETLRASRVDHASDTAHRYTCLQMASTLKRFNANFDRERFLAACGASTEEG